MYEGTPKGSWEPRNSRVAREPLRGSRISQGPRGFRNPGKLYFPRSAKGTLEGFQGLLGPEGLQFPRGGPRGFRNLGKTYL